MERRLAKAIAVISGFFVFWLCAHFGYFYFIDLIMNSRFIAFSRGYLYHEIGHYELVITFIEAQAVFFICSISIAIYSGFSIKRNIATIINNILSKQQSSHATDHA